MDEKDAQAASEIFFRLFKTGRLDLVRNVLVHVPEQPVDRFDDLRAKFIKTEIEIDDRALDENADPMLEAILKDARDNVDGGKPWYAIESLSSQFNAMADMFKKRGVSLEKILAKADEVKKIAADAGHKVGATEYTIAFGVVSMVTISLHFKITGPSSSD
ncbi:MAG: hypothetical protein RIA64_08855 [Rhodospirillales bacterium]